MEHPIKPVTLITGGARSGKSRYALEAAMEVKNKAFIATAQAFDEEMRLRIERHQRERGREFNTVEEPFDIASAITSLDAKCELVIVDCLTLWLSNLAHRHGAEAKEYPEVIEFLSIIENPPCEIVIVSNEIGMGVVPENELARRFRDLAGWLNQRVAKLASKVVFMVSGLPLMAKEEKLDGSLKKDNCID